MADLIDRDKLLCAYCTDCNSGVKKPCPIPGRCHEFNLIKNAPAVNRWIPVEDALPDTLQNVLVCTDINTVTVAWINGEGWTFADTGNGHTENWTFEAVKYWMPLPEPPEGGADDAT